MTDASTKSSEIPEELEITVIKKVNGVHSQEIKMKLPSDTTFGNIIKFMNEQKLFNSRNVVVRPRHKENQTIGHNRKIQECYNLIQLSFILEEIPDSKSMAGKSQVLRNEGDYQAESTETNRICGK